MLVQAVLAAFLLQEALWSVWIPRLQLRTILRLSSVHDTVLMVSQWLLVAFRIETLRHWLSFHHTVWILWSVGGVHVVLRLWVVKIMVPGRPGWHWAVRGRGSCESHVHVLLLVDVILLDVLLMIIVVLLQVNALCLLVAGVQSGIVVWGLGLVCQAEVFAWWRWLSVVHIAVCVGDVICAIGFVKSEILEVDWRLARLHKLMLSCEWPLESGLFLVINSCISGTSWRAATDSSDETLHQRSFSFKPFNWLLAFELMARLLDDEVLHGRSFWNLVAAPHFVWLVHLQALGDV